jgi:hypothetical protein
LRLTGKPSLESDECSFLFGNRVGNGWKLAFAAWKYCIVELFAIAHESMECLWLPWKRQDVAGSVGKGVQHSDSIGHGM